MKRNSKVKRLHALQIKIDKIRRELNINAPGDVLYRESLYADTDEELVVVADGLGGATASIIEGNYPIDFFTRYEKAFATEAAAMKAADEVSEGGITPAELLR